jgi:hypothetical protein
MLMAESDWEEALYSHIEDRVVLWYVSRSDNAVIGL